jgi:hypothetical protein
MTKIATDFASKLAVAFVAVAMVFAAFAPAAQAQSSEDLQQMINDLLAQVAQLQGTTTSGSMGSCDAHFFADLGQGASNADVMKLQQFLNMDEDTRVAAAGSVGSAGMETMYYGPATAAAVSKFQVKYRAEILSPLGLVNPTGYWGAGSRAKANAICATGVEEGGEEEETEEETEEGEEEEEDFVLRGSANLDAFEVEDGESSIEEGDEDVEVGEINVEFENGDAEIGRIDLSIAQSGVDSWDVFETISLWVDGDKIAEVDASDEDEYLDEDEGQVRFSNLDLIAEEDEELTITVAVSVQSGVDEDDMGDFDLTVDSMRFFDADGVATTEDDFDDLGNEVITFEVEEAGTDEELDISLSSSNPDGTDIIVDTDSDTNDVTIMVADIEAEDNDIELNTVVVKVETTIGNITDVVDEVRVIIDGEEFDAEAIGTEADYDAAADNDTSGATGLSEGRSERADANNTVWYLFDIDGDVVIDADEEVEMEVVVDFNDTDDGDRYSNGSTIKASITSVETDEWEAEGADDLDDNQFSGSAVGDAHTIVAEGIVVPADAFSSETDTLGNDDTIGEFTLEFDVTAVEGDFYIAEAASQSTGSSTGGVQFAVSGVVGTGTVTASLDSTADFSVDDAYTVREGETETFTLTVTIDPQATGTFRVTLEDVWFSEDTDGENGVEYSTIPASDFRTNTQAIQG